MLFVSITFVLGTQLKPVFWWNICLNSIRTQTLACCFGLVCIKPILHGNANFFALGPRDVIKEDIKISNKGWQNMAKDCWWAYNIWHSFKIQKYAEVWQELPTVYKKTLTCIGNNNWMSSPGVTLNLTCGKGVTELQNLTNLRLSSFAETHHRRCNRRVLMSPLISKPCGPNGNPQFTYVDFRLFVSFFPRWVCNPYSTRTWFSVEYGLYPSCTPPPPKPVQVVCLTGTNMLVSKKPKSMDNP